MKNKLKIPFLFFILIYFNQGWFDLPSQAIYYLVKEFWGMGASTVGLIAFISGFAWYAKPIWGILLDFFRLGKNSTRSYLTISYIGLLLFYGIIVCFGINLFSLIFIGVLINCCIGLADVANDKQMVVLEQKHNFQGKLQAIQWGSLGIAGLIVSLAGAKISDLFAPDVAYRVAYGLAMIVPIVILIYLYTGFKEEKTIVKKINWKQIFSEFKNKQLVWSLLFVGCLQLCPSFGIGLMAQARENLGVSKMFLGYLSATGTVLGITGYALYYWKFYKFDIKKLLYFMICFTVVTNLFYLYIPNKWFLVGYNLAFGTVSGITFLTLLAFFAKIVPKGNEGMFYAIITSLSNLCGRGGSWIGGMIYDHFGYHTNVWVSSIFTAFCLIIIPKLKIKE
ncbi:MAG: MFS transporter [Candidatus Helarchaeota archaeon]